MHLKNFVSHLTVRPSAGPSAHPYAPQEDQFEMSHFLASIWACNFIIDIILWSIDSCQNRVSADQDHMTVSRAQALTLRNNVFSAEQLLAFNWLQAQVYVFS